MDIGDFKQETHLHLLTCPCTSRNRLKLAKTINNDCKQYYKPEAVTPNLDFTEEEEIIAGMGSSWDTADAWKGVTADKHGLERTIDTGQPDGNTNTGSSSPNGHTILCATVKTTSIHMINVPTSQAL
jgi:hypothetical protein